MVRRCVVLLMSCLMLLALLSGCGGNDAETPDATPQTGAAPEPVDDSAEIVETHHFNADGLLDRYVWKPANGQEQTAEIRYTFDAQGRPAAVAFQMGDYGCSAELENVCEGDRVTAVIIRNCQEDSDPAFSNASDVYERIVMHISNYTGYRDAEIQAEGTGSYWKLQDGEVVSMRSEAHGSVVEKEVIKDADGSASIVQRYYYDLGSDTPSTVTTMTIDASGKLTHYAVDGTSFDVRYEQEGESRLVGRIANLQTAGDEGPAEGDVFCVYDTASDGRVERFEVVGSDVTSYDPAGRIIRTEHGTDALKLVVIYEYE